jgi:hypothetical protein
VRDSPSVAESAAARTLPARIAEGEFQVEHRAQGVHIRREVDRARAADERRRRRRRRWW